MNMLFLLLLPGHQDTVVGITVVRLSISRLIGKNDLSKIITKIVIGRRVDCHDMVDNNYLLVRKTSPN